MLAFFASNGVGVHRVLSDNGSCYRADLFQDTLASAGVRTINGSVNDVRGNYS